MPYENIVILSDSKAAIQAIVNLIKPPINAKVAQCRDTIKYLNSLTNRITLQWIPAHCGIVGNELADALAKKGTQINQTSTSEISYNSAITTIQYQIREEQKKKLTERTEGCHWKDNLSNIPDWPRKEAVACFRMATGHDCLAKHLHRIGIYTSPTCTLCNQNEMMDSSHLNRCRSLSKPTLWERYWEAREMMSILIL